MSLLFPTVVACDEAARPDALATAQGRADAAVILVVGLEHWETGEYTLRVAGDGAVTLINLRAGNQRTWTAQWDSARTAAFYDALRADGFLSVSPPKGPRQPGDVPLVFRVEGPLPYEAQLWEADRYTLPGVDRIVSRLDALTKELSGE